MDNATRQLMTRLLEGKREPELDDAKAIQALARDILLTDLDKMAEEVRKELGRWKQERAWNADHTSRMYYVFLSPPSEPELIDSTPNAEVFTPSQRTEYRVKVRDLKAFSKAQGLNEKDMVRVGMGEIEEHRGWIRRGGYGGPMELGQPYQKPRLAAPARSVDGPKEKRTVFRFAPKPIEWFPGLDS